VTTPLKNGKRGKQWNLTT